MSHEWGYKPEHFLYATFATLFCIPALKTVAPPVIAIVIIIEYGRLCLPVTITPENFVRPQSA